MAPLANPQKTPNQKRHLHGGGGGGGSGSSGGPVIPRPADDDQPGFHGSSFTEHRSPAFIPDTPLHEPRDAQSRDTDEKERNGAAVNPSSSPSLASGFPVQSNPNPPSSNRAPRLRPQPSFSATGQQQQPTMSPWQHFAATGGAMTPSVERPGGEAISPFFGMALAAGNPGQAGAGAFPGFNMTLPTASAANQATNPAAPRSQSPHLGGPFAQLTLGSGTTTRPNAATPGAGSTTTDPFLSFPVGNTSSSSSIGGGEGNMDALAATLAARRRGSRSGPSGLSKSMNAEDASHTPAAKPKPRLPSGPVASGMQLNLPPGLGSSRKSPLAATSSAAASSPLVPDAMSPSELAAHMHDSNSRLLILDLRQPSAFIAGHAAHAVSLPIPSTLLKRQAFTLEKLQDMLPARSARVIADWKRNSDVVIVDQDSTAANIGSVIAGMANKFRASDVPPQESWHGKIWFLKGGMSACKNTQEIDLEYGTDDDEDTAVPASEDGSVGTANGSASEEQTASSASSSTAASGKAGKLFGGLSRAAFQHGSTRGMARKRAGAPQSITLPNSPGPLRLDLRGTGFGTGMSSERHTSTRVLTNDADAPLTGTSNATAIAGRRRMSSADDSPRAQVGQGDVLQPANPFFDNIRQNLELSHGGITERISLNLPPEIASRAPELPSFLRDLVEKPENETAAILANEFENVERDEQRRLQSIMEWHSRGMKHIDEAFKAGRRHRRKERRRMSVGTDGSGEDSANRKMMRVQRTQSGMVQVKSVDAEEGPDTPEDYFPFSITAGVERGAKNRYKNIWPYDFSRVRLAAKCHDDGSDYINANFIHPQGTTKRYIATQGPLDATFRDFWTLVWEQHVDVIVMLTKQYEGGAIKCGSYWTDGAYGPLHLQLLSTVGGEDKPEKAVSGFDFHVGNDKPATGTPNIHRVFLLSHDEYPDSPPRKITQIQCIAWPDFDVPEDPHTLLGLVKEVDQASEEMAADADDQGHKPPVLVHCSAGVGRTGSYIVVDAMLDALRREHHAHHRKIRGTSQGLSRRRQSRQYEQNIFSPESVAARSNDRRASCASSSDISVGSLGSPGLSPPLQEGGHTHSPFLPFPAMQSFTFSPPTTNAADQMDIDRASDHAPSQMRRISEEAKSGTSQSPREYDLVDEIESIPRITARRREVLDPTPVLEMSQPVKRILSNMRVQRMSLCQSLRQYLFVYRAIIIGYLDMLDEEKEIEQELSASASSTNIASRTHNHSGTTTDEESQSKRRAPDDQLGGSSLTKRPSLKSFSSKRRSNNSGSDESRFNLNPLKSSSGTPPLLNRPSNMAETRTGTSPTLFNPADKDTVPAQDSGNHDMDTS